MRKNKKKRSINIRYDYFKQESPYYNQIFNILNLNSENNSGITKQLLIEKWIIDYENYRIRDLIEKHEIVKSTEAKIYSNIFRSLDKEWDNKLSLYKINNYRDFKKLYNKGIEKNNICNSKFLV